MPFLCLRLSSASASIFLLAGEAADCRHAHDDSTHDGLILPPASARGMGRGTSLAAPKPTEEGTQPDGGEGGGMGHGTWLAAPKPTEEGTQPDGGEGGGMGHGARGERGPANAACRAVAACQTI